MPYKPKHPCSHPGCPALADSGERYCEKHKPLHPEAQDTRPSAASRGYGKRWQKVSKMYLLAHPLCAKCLERGKYTKATVVDHIRPHRGDMKLFWDPNNWQALCKPCHDRKTGFEDSRPKYTY